MAMNNRKKLFKVPVTWQVTGHHTIEAWNEEKAADEARNMALPGNPVYVEGSDEVFADEVTEISREQAGIQISERAGEIIMKPYEPKDIEIKW